MIDLPSKNDLGDLGAYEQCPSGSYAASARLRIEKEGSGDNTGVNGVELECRTQDGNVVGTITSAQATRGEWLAWKTCGDGFITKAQLRDEAPGSGKHFVFHVIAILIIVHWLKKYLCTVFRSKC